MTVPEGWKITFSPWSNQGGNTKSYGQTGVQNSVGWMLRLYETKERQRAVFTNVVQFRDLSLPIRRKKLTLTTEHGPERADVFTTEEVTF